MDLSFDAKVISAEAVLATSYWCADRIVADITQDGEVVKVSLSGRSGTAWSFHLTDCFYPIPALHFA
ncbi:MAG: hypothetical protein ACI4TC_07445, partial [Kiritimatiellia bacterium]